MAKNIIVLGGGYAGVLTAKKLAKKIKKQRLGEEVSVTLLDKNPFHTMLTELHEVAAGRVPEESIKMNLKKIFAGRNVNVVMDEIAGVDFQGNKLLSKNRSKTYDYDYLVLGTGSKPAFFDTPGAEDASFTLWSYDDAVKLKEQILGCFRAAAKETDPEERRKLLTFFVVGGGFTGVEMAGELAEWIPNLCDSHDVDQKEVRLYLADMMDRILTSIPGKLSAKAVKRLNKMGVEVLTGAKVSGVATDSIEVLREGGGDKPTVFPAKTVIWTAGIEGSAVIQSSDMEKAKGGRVETDEFLACKQYKNVYVAGDNLYYIPQGETYPVPQMVENAEASSGTAAHNIICDITGKGKKESYAPKFHGMMVCIGGRFGTAYVGTHKKKFALPSFLAMFSKHFINLIYFVQVLGWNKIYDYMVHEFFQVRHNRSFVGGHFSNASPKFWTYPLRLFLGFYWLNSGLQKLPRILNNFTDIFLIPGYATGGADAVSTATITESATSVATAAADAVTAATVVTTPQATGGFFSQMWDWFGALDTVHGASVPVPGFLTNMFNWVVENLLMGRDALAGSFQAFMVAAEILVGVFLIIGLFTTLTSLFSCLLSLMIYMSGWSDVNIIWCVLAAVAMIGIGGRGQVLALDYYLMPRLKSWWKKRKIVQKLYIYNN